MLIDDVLAELRPGGPAASVCTGLQLGASSVAIKTIVQAHARDEKKPDPVRLAATLAAATRRFEASFLAALTRDACVVSVPPAEASAVLAAGAARLVGKLFPLCGDGVQGPGEECDGSDRANCVGACLAACSCVTTISCPCWTNASLDATFPPGFFDANGRGGVQCAALPGDGFIVGTVDTCELVGPQHELSVRGGAAVFNGSCVLAADLDPDNDGFCPPGPFITSNVDAAEIEACLAELHQSQVYQSSCN
jgi:hypothetical protein